MGTIFCGLMMMDMFMDTLNCGFQIICNLTNVNKYWNLKFVNCPTHQNLYDVCFRQRVAGQIIQDYGYLTYN